MERNAPVEIETLQADPASALLSRSMSIIAGDCRQVEVWSALPGILLKVSGGSDFYITSCGRAILCIGKRQDDVSGDKVRVTSVLSKLDREILLGPALVLALAMCGTWCLHASAAMYQDKVVAFVGESGRGKSTLAAFLSRVDWRLVADDILPVTSLSHGLTAWPHFPQLKLPIEMQPGVGLPEHLPLHIILELVPARPNDMPEVKLLPPEQAVRVLLGHVAGARLFSQPLLAKHLDFCARAAERIPVYRLAYPHWTGALPAIKKLLQKLC